jgi:hypothetical protein
MAKCVFFWVAAQIQRSFPVGKCLPSAALASPAPKGASPLATSRYIRHKTGMTGVRAKKSG